MTPPTDTQLDEHTVSVSWLWPMWRRFVIRTLSLAASMAVFLSLSSITAQAEGTDPRIVKIKAAFAYTLAKFVEWPDNAFKDKTSPLVICIGEDDVFTAAQQSIQGKAVKTRAIDVRPLESRKTLNGCHVAMLSEGSDNSEILHAAREHHILTIGCGKDFALSGGMVASYFVNNKLRFSINLTSAREAGLTISSRALGLAQDVIHK